MSKSNLIGITDKKTGKSYMRGENPYMDMQINNYELWKPEYGDNHYGFVKNDYEPIYESEASGNA